MPGTIESRLAELGIELPPVSKPVGNYVGCKLIGDHLSVGGHGPITKDGVVQGKVGADVSLDVVLRYLTRSA